MASVANESKTGGTLPIVRRGEVSDSEFYEAVWSRVFNHGARDARLPKAVAFPQTTAHVQEAIRLAAAEKCSVSVRSGGHSWAAWSVRDDAILVDLSRLDIPLEYDAQTGIVTCGPATTGRILNGWLKTKGRLFAGGHCPDVGLGGFLLQGGMGWNCKNWGWACESVTGIDVVTADGNALHCNEKENADLFWAARGAGPGFPAIVTRWHLKTRPLPELYQSLYFYPTSELSKVLQWVIDSGKVGDPDTEIVCLAVYAPHSKEVQILANFLTFKANRAEGLRVLTPIHESRPGGAELEVFAKDSDMDEQYCDQDAANPLGYRYCSDDAYISNDADVPAVLEEACLTLPTRESFILYYAMYPTSRRKLPDMALSMHSDHYFAIYAVWKDAADDERVRTWVASTMKRVERHGVGSYLGDADFRIRGARFWGVEEGKKLVEMRKRWDPEGRVAGFLDGGRGVRNEHDWIHVEQKPE